ncbi:MAG: hypothetical protein IIA17_04385 [candidate division Zixibacteria bacterium]|nr:hypothetical protein [candidate division Zixibacteria bacterium]
MGTNDKTIERKCLGRTKLTRRCRNSVSSGLFCSVHKMQPYVYLRRLLVGSIGLAAAIFTLSAMCGPSEEEQKLRSIVYSLVNSACHSWKNAYIALVPGHFSQHNEEYSHVWDMLIKVEPPKYSEKAWRYYFPLFDQSAIYVREELDRLLASYPDVIPEDLRALIEETKIQIEIEQSAYQQLTRILRTTDDKDVFFQVRFQSIIRVLAKLSREADRLRHEID